MKVGNIIVLSLVGMVLAALLPPMLGVGSGGSNSASSSSSYGSVTAVK